MEWKNTPLGPQPEWIAEPDIKIVEQLAHAHLGAIKGQTNINDTSFLAAGAFNKLYLIDSDKGKFIMRVSMPVYPKYKTFSEVSTMQWIRQNTKIPVPDVIAFDDSRDNSLGFEWILMDMMPGTSLYYRWRKMPMEAKKKLVKDVAGYQAELLSCKIEPRSIGNIYRTADTTNQSPTKVAQRVKAGTFEVGRMVALEFFWGDRIDKTIPRGPFPNSYEWLQTRLDLAINEQQAKLSEVDDEDDREEAEDALWLGERLATLLPKVLAPSGRSADAEPTVLWHRDLSQSNILLDDDNEITAILDWECVSVLPAWVAMRVPPFLESRVRPRPPNREEAAKEEDCYKRSDDDEPDLDNEGIADSYWEALLEHEQTMLRPVYLAEMEHLHPGFEAQREASRAASSLHHAVLYFTDWLSMKRVSEWIDGMEEGECQDLWQREEVEVVD